MYAVQRYSCSSPAPCYASVVGARLCCEGGLLPATVLLNGCHTPSAPQPARALLLPFSFHSHHLHLQHTYSYMQDIENSMQLEILSIGRFL